MNSMAKYSFLFVIAFLFCGGVFAGPTEHDMWRSYMSHPNDQTIATVVCGIQAPLHCVEGLYNYYYNLGAAKVDFDSSSIAGSNARAMTTLGVFYNYGAKPLASIGTFPNYSEAVYKIAAFDSIPLSGGTSAILTQLTKTPVIFRITNWCDIASLTKDYDLAPISHNPNNVDDDDFHYIVVVDSGKVGNDLYFDCMSSFGLRGDQGFFKIYASNIEKWCSERIYARIHDSSSYTSLDYSCAPLIIPRFIPCGSSVLQNITTNSTLYVFGDWQLAYDATIGLNKKVYVEPDYPNPPYSPITSSIIIPEYRTLTLRNNVKITKRGNSGYWSGITIQSGQTEGRFVFAESDTVEYAKTGITTYSNNNIYNGSLTSNSSVIQKCRDYGIYAYNCAPLVQYLKFLANGDSSYSAIAGIRVEGASSNVIVEKVKIAGSSKGFSLAGYTDATLRYSNIESTCANNIVIGAYSYLALAGRQNNIYTGSGYAIDNDANSDDTEASGNYFSIERFRYPGKVFGTFALSPFSNGAPAKIAASFTLLDRFDYVRILEEKSDWDAAIAEYKKILAETDDTHVKRQTIKSIMKAVTRRNMEDDKTDCEELRNIVLDELRSATSAYKTSLDYILCEILVKETMYREAVDAFRSTASQYAGTSMEVEMLTRVATIYGLYLDDKSKAREYADRAASINPGQDCLYIAYRTAGIDYQPWKFTDRYKGVQENFDTPPEQPKPMEDTEFITVSPNPANPITTISYSIGNVSHVRLFVYSINGQKIATLVNGPVSAGAHAVTFDGSKLASGVYFYRFESAGMKRSGKLLILK